MALGTSTARCQHSDVGVAPGITQTQLDMVMLCSMAQRRGAPGRSRPWHIAAEVAVYRRTPQYTSLRIAHNALQRFAAGDGS